MLYGYDSTNHRIYKGAYNSGTYSAEEIYLCGAEGHKYGTWQIDPSSGVLLKASVVKQWFGNWLVSPQDRLDSRGKYFPFGQERTKIDPPNPANDQEKFASYTRDGATGLDLGGLVWVCATDQTRRAEFEWTCTGALDQIERRIAADGLR